MKLRAASWRRIVARLRSLLASGVLVGAAILCKQEVLLVFVGGLFAFFLLSEYGGIVVMSAVASVLYLGGYRAIPGLGFIPEPLWMAAKIGALSFFVIWLRATYPRLREDQLQQFSWLALIPLALVQVMVVAIVKVAARAAGRRAHHRRALRHGAQNLRHPQLLLPQRHLRRSRQADQSAGADEITKAKHSWGRSLMTCVFVLAYATLAMLTGVCLVSKFEVIQLEESESYVK